MWPADSLEKALDVAWKESNYLARADNGICCLGVFQINYGSHKRRLAARGLGREGLFDARVNIEIAIEIFNEQGWSPWTTA
jgi:Transglycosylase SLT domain